MSTDNLLSRRDVDAQYRPNGYTLSPGLQRARAPFRIRNAVTGILVGSFAVGVWAYSIRAVKQDTFEDVDEEAKAMLSARTQQAQPAEAKTAVELVTPAISTSNSTIAAETPSVPTTLAPSLTGCPVGVLGSLLDGQYPRLLDPRKTLVWGAPPVDRIGRLSDQNL